MTRTDAEAFAEFVRATGPRLHRSALLLTGDHHLTEDLTQATYARVYASWRRVSRADDPLAYARRTLLNTYLSHRRLRRNSELPADPTLGPEPASPEADHATPHP
ncbi:sigma factor, partial [Nocardioides hankookensis]